MSIYGRPWKVAVPVILILVGLGISVWFMPWPPNVRFFGSIIIDAVLAVLIIVIIGKVLSYE